MRILLVILGCILALPALAGYSKTLCWPEDDKSRWPKEAWFSADTDETHTTTVDYLVALGKRVSRRYQGVEHAQRVPEPTGTCYSVACDFKEIRVNLARGLVYIISFTGYGQQQVLDKSKGIHLFRSKLGLRLYRSDDDGFHLLAHHKQNLVCERYAY